MGLPTSREDVTYNIQAENSVNEPRDEVTALQSGYNDLSGNMDKHQAQRIRSQRQTRKPRETKSRSLIPVTLWAGKERDTLTDMLKPRRDKSLLKSQESDGALPRLEKQIARL